MKTMIDKFNLSGRVALITGASGLLGVEHAKALLDLGAIVIMTDIDEAGLSRSFSHLINIYDENNIICKVMDVTNQKSIENISDELDSDGLNINILINNAAIDPKVQANSLVEASRLENFTINDWDFQISVGLTGAMLCSKIFGSKMARKGGGVIINIASDLSVFAPDQRLYKKDGLLPHQQPVKPITYSVVKHGLIGLTKYIATYWADKDVRCNALSPGGVYTSQDDEFVNRLSNLIPMARMSKKDEYRGAIQFMCSDASSYMNGQNIVIDGGRSVL